MGKDSAEMEQYRYRKGIQCATCQEIIYSHYRHGYNACSCLSCTIDGGNSYLKYSGNGKLVTIDLIEKKVV